MNNDLPAPQPTAPAELATPEQLGELFSDTMGKPTSLMDTLTIYRAGKEDYFKRGDEKVASVLGVLLYSQRPMRTWWPSDEISDSPPSCWSLDSIAPHPDSNEAQADKCEQCPHDKFGSALKGRGKACKTRAADFVLEVAPGAVANLPILTPSTIPVVKLTPALVVGTALVRYGIGNREAANSYANLMRFAKERATYVQGLICRWGFVRGTNKSNVEYDVVEFEPVAKIDDDSIQKLVVPMVRSLKGGQAISVLTALAGQREDETNKAG